MIPIHPTTRMNFESSNGKLLIFQFHHLKTIGPWIDHLLRLATPACPQCFALHPPPCRMEDWQCSLAMSPLCGKVPWWRAIVLWAKTLYLVTLKIKPFQHVVIPSERVPYVLTHANMNQTCTTMNGDDDAAGHSKHKKPRGFMRQGSITNLSTDSCRSCCHGCKDELKAAAMVLLIFSLLFGLRAMHQQVSFLISNNLKSQVTSQASSHINASQTTTAIDICCSKVMTSKLYLKQHVRYSQKQLYTLNIFWVLKLLVLGGLKVFNVYTKLRHFFFWGGAYWFPMFLTTMLKLTPCYFEVVFIYLFWLYIMCYYPNMSYHLKQLHSSFSYHHHLLHNPVAMVARIKVATTLPLNAFPHRSWTWLHVNLGFA